MTFIGITFKHNCMLNATFLVVMMNAVILSVDTQNMIKLNVILLNFIILSDVLLCLFMSVILLSVIMLSAIIVSVHHAECCLC